MNKVYIKKKTKTTSFWCGNNYCHFSLVPASQTQSLISLPLKTKDSLFSDFSLPLSSGDCSIYVCFVSIIFFFSKLLLAIYCHVFADLSIYFLFFFFRFCNIQIFGLYVFCNIRLLPCIFFCLLNCPWIWA
jgi:hypothetical protein